MGDAQKDVLRVNFDPRIKREFHGAIVTTDAGLLAYRELDDAFGLTDQVGAAAFDDPPPGTNNEGDQGSRVAKLCAASDVRLAKRPDCASEGPLWNGPLHKRIAFGLDEPQNGELLARRGRLRHDQNRYEKSRFRLQKASLP
jgi:hypothetical protein